MKVVFEFNLPEDRDSLAIYQQAEGMFSVISNLQASLRYARKFGDGENGSEHWERILFDRISEENIDMEIGS